MQLRYIVWGTMLSGKHGSIGENILANSLEGLIIGLKEGVSLYSATMDQDLRAGDRTQWKSIGKVSQTKTTQPDDNCRGYLTCGKWCSPYLLEVEWLP